MASAQQEPTAAVSSTPTSPSPEMFLEGYRKAERRPWDIRRPQREVVAAEQGGLLSGDILDAGCGLGDNAVYLATKGHKVTAFDFSPEALAEARRRMSAAAEGPAAPADFVQANAMDLGAAFRGRQFDTVLDSALFHCFPAPERRRYTKSLAPHVKSGGRVVLFCFSDKNADPWRGPHRISQQDLRDTFDGDTWTIDEVTETSYESIVHDGGAAAAYRMLATRL